MTTEAPPATSGDTAVALPTGLVMLARLAVLGGVAALVAGMLSSHAQAAWTVLLVNFLYWTGLSQAGVVWAATLHVARAGWSAPIRRLGQACAAFLPITFIPGIALYVGREWILPWIGQDMGDRAAWMNVPSLFIRNAVGLGFLTVLSLIYARRDNRVEPVDDADESGATSSSALAIAMLIAYAVVYSILAFDFVMGLRPFWYSTLIGAYFFCGAMFAAMAFIVLVSAIVGRSPDSAWRLNRQQWLDIRNLLMAFGMLTAYMFFAQLLVIWYGNLPVETDFLIARHHYQPWYSLTWAVILGAFIIPFCLLAFTPNKAQPRFLACVAGLVLIAMWAERYLLVAPSLMPRGVRPGAVELFGTLGFAGAFVLAFDWSLKRSSLRVAHGADARTSAPSAAE